MSRQTIDVVRHVGTAVVILIIGVAIFAWMGPPPAPARVENEIKPLSVRPGTVSRQPELVIAVDGEVVPLREISVAAQVSGEIIGKDALCETGKEVSETSELVRIDKTDYVIEEKRLIEQQAQAEASLKELEQEIANGAELEKLAVRDVELAQSDIDRLEKLPESAKSKSEEDRAEKAFILAKNSLRSVKNSITLAETRKKRLESAIALSKIQLGKAHLDLERTTVKSPIKGVITEEFVETGSYVQKGAPLFKVLDNSRVEVRCQLRAEQLYWIWNQHSSGERGGTDLIPTPVTVEYHIAGREDVIYCWKGILDRYDGVGFDRETGTAPCRVVVSKPREAEIKQTGSNSSAPPPPQLFQGMHVSLKIKVKPRATILQVPVAAVRQPGPYLWKLPPQTGDKKQRVELVNNLRLIQQFQDKLGRNFWLIDATGGDLEETDHVVVSPFSGDGSSGVTLTGS